MHKEFYKKINDYFKNKVTCFNFNYNPNGTIFQKKVWKEICKIKPGKTKTYKEIAKKLGTSPRAVGNACSKNICLIIIPCHRVICTNGNIGKFILGKKIKNYLINLEKNGT